MKWRLKIVLDGMSWMVCIYVYTYPCLHTKLLVNKIDNCAALNYDSFSLILQR